MLPSRHIMVSLPLGVTVGFFTQSAYAGLLCFLCGVLIDVDHFIEYAIHYGLRSFTFKEIYQACDRMANNEEEGGVKKLYLFLHAGEIAILLWMSYAFSRNFYLLSIAIGYTGHLIMDAINNTKKIKAVAYFIILRAINGFDIIRPEKH